MGRAGRALMLALGLWLGLGALPALGLTVEQVIALKKAGLSDDLIQRLIEHETKLRLQGGGGRYVLKQESGGEVIVYEARTPRGVVDYPLEGLDAENAGRVAGALGLERRPAGAGPAAGGAPREGKAAKAGGGKGPYTLHLASFQKEDQAGRLREELKAKGMEARVAAVDLPGKGRWYRVVTGSYPSLAEAQAQAEAVKRAAGVGYCRPLPEQVSVSRD